MKKRIFSVLLALTIVFTMRFAGGSTFAAEGIAISTPEDLKAMENNPSGSYYLTNDIEVPENLSLFSTRNPFTGTFDGKGYKLKNYKVTGTGSYMEKALFISAKNATFRNFSMTDIDINADSSTLSKAATDSIAAGGNNTFTAVPNTGLAAGTYTATVTVSGEESITAQSFVVSFTVNAPSNPGSYVPSS